MNGNPVVVVHNHLYLFWLGFNNHGTQETISFWEALTFFLMVTEYHKFLWQLKNAESILEYERMAEIGFEKRDFRMVSYSLDTVCVCVCYLWGVLCHKYLPSQASRTAGICLCLGCLLHGPCLGFCLRLSQVQDTKSRVFSPAGAIPRGSVCSQVRMHTWKDLFIFLTLLSKWYDGRKVTEVCSCPNMKYNKTVCFYQTGPLECASSDFHAGWRTVTMKNHSWTGHRSLNLITPVCLEHEDSLLCLCVLLIICSE